MTNFEILALIGFAGVIGMLLGIRRVLGKIERHLFGIRYHFPFIESDDTWRLMSIKENNEETPGELDEWFASWKGGQKPLLLYEIYEMKRFLNSIDDNLKKLDEERNKKS
jgi:hypothetical protein